MNTKSEDLKPEIDRLAEAHRRAEMDSILRAGQELLRVAGSGDIGRETPPAASRAAIVLAAVGCPWEPRR